MSRLDTFRHRIREAVVTDEDVDAFVETINAAVRERRSEREDNATVEVMLRSEFDRLIDSALAPLVRAGRNQAALLARLDELAAELAIVRDAPEPDRFVDKLRSTPAQPVDTTDEAEALSIVRKLVTEQQADLDDIRLHVASQIMHLGELLTAAIAGWTAAPEAGAIAELHRRVANLEEPPAPAGTELPSFQAWQKQQQPESLVSVAHEHVTARPVVVLGCGDARVYAGLAELFDPNEILGVESDPAIMRAAAATGVTVTAGNPLAHMHRHADGSVGTILAVAETEDDQAAMTLLAQAERVLADDGCLVIALPPSSGDFASYLEHCA